MDTNTIDDNDAPSIEAQKFADVVSGIYRRFDAESVRLALRYAINNQLFSENPTIMLMFVRIAEVYPDAAATLGSYQVTAQGAERQAIDLVLEPPQEIRNAKYLPDSIQSPGEMDLCWAEFLVTGKIASVEKILDVLDRDDLTRTFLAQSVSTEESAKLRLSDENLMELQSYGIGLGKNLEVGNWDVMTPGDTDIFLWLGVKDQNATCQRILDAMPQSTKLHLANKGAALWSLQANALQHGAIRLLCEQAAKAPGGFARQLLIASQ